MKLFFVICLLTVLFGCSSQPIIVNAPIPAALTQPCQEPTPLIGMVGKDLMDWFTVNGAIWKQCRMDKAALNSAVTVTQNK